MVKIKLLIVLLLTTVLLHAQNTIVGKWKTIDDKTNQVMSIVEFYEKDNKFYGKLLKIINVDKHHSTCKKCSSKIKNNSLIGKEIIKDLQQDKDQFKSGKLIDPFSDKEYSCYIKLLSSNSLQIKGYVGIPLFGRTQYWERIK